MEIMNTCPENQKNSDEIGIRTGGDLQAPLSVSIINHSTIKELIIWILWFEISLSDTFFNQVGKLFFQITLLYFIDFASICYIY